MAVVVTDASKTQAPETSAKDEYLQTARERFRTAVTAESTLRANMLEDKRFRASEQWPEEVKAAREAEKRPCLTVNRLPQFIRQITGQQRENKPAATVSAIDSLADPDVAEVLQGIIRHIENNSRAQSAYNTAGDDQATMGRGFIRILAEYADPHDMDLSLVIRRVRNAFTIYMDPASHELDYSDANWAFVVSDITATEFKRRYKDVAGASGADFQSIGDQKADWYLEDTVRIAEYWTVDVVPDVLYQLETQDTILKSEVPPGMEIPDPANPDRTIGVVIGGTPFPIVKKRPVERREVSVSVINGIEILEGNDEKTGGMPWPNVPGKTPSEFIPIIPVIGEEIDINGKVDLRGIVRDAKDPQRRYNYSVSATTETAALAPKSPWIMADGQDEGHEQEWKNANVLNYSSLKYKPVELSGQLVGPPQRNNQEPPIQAMVMLTQQADMDLMNVTGRYQAGLGAAGPEQSGKAIMARQRQGDIGAFGFQDNLNFAVATVGKYLVHLIPKVYSPSRIVRIQGEDGAVKSVMVHAGGTPPKALPPGVEGIYDVGLGRYDVTVSSGPSYASRRQEFREMATQLSQAYPPAAPVLLPMLARNMDVPFAKELAEKLGKLLPPELQDKKPGEPAPPSPEVMAQMQQMDQMIKQLTAELEKAQQTLQSKQIENASEVEQEKIAASSRVKVAEIESATVLRKTDAMIQADLALGNRKALTAETTARLNLLKSTSPRGPGGAGTS